MADTRKQTSNGAWKRVYKPTQCYLTSNRENGNPYAVGVFNFVTVYLLLVPLAILISNSYYAGRLFFDLSGYIVVIGYPSEWLTVALILLAEFTLSFVIYFCFLAWIACYKKIGSVTNVPFMLLLIATIIASRRTVFLSVFELELHPAGRITCCVQQLILCMKWISFVQENACKVLYPWKKDDEKGPAVWYGGQMEPQVGSFSSYLYFLFCPVLLYRDRYPRKPPNYRKALISFFQFVVSTLVGCAIFNDFLIPKSMHLDTLVMHLLRNLFAGFVQLSLGHVCIFYTWCNAWAELLGFADHSFYHDWWNGRSMGEYLWKWNPMVHDWLKEHLHRHLKKFIPSIVSMLVVLLLSGIEHDVLISTGLGYFMPMYLVQYGIISGLIQALKPPLGEWVDQMIMCTLLVLGCGVQLFVYCTEVAAHTLCPTNTTAWYNGLQMIDCYRKLN